MKRRLIGLINRTAPGLILAIMLIGLYFPITGDSQVPSNVIRMSVGTGTSDTGTQRVVLASDSPGGDSTVDTEFPAAAALTDTFANPTTTSVAAMNMVWTGSIWERVTPDTIAIPVNVTQVPFATAGVTPIRRTSAGASEDEQEICAVPCNLYSVALTNTAATVSYWRCYNLTAANTTPGTSTVVVDAAIPGNTTGAGIHLKWANGLQMSVALTCTFVKGAADTDVAEVGANEIKAIYEKK